jgi:hypothetical protein
MIRFSTRAAKVAASCCAILLTFAASVPAHAYWAWGRTWTSPSTVRYVYGWAASFTSAEEQAVHRAAVAYNLTTGSSLRVGGATFTSSVSALDNAAFQIARTTPTGDFPDSVPGVTWRGQDDPRINFSNRAIVFLNPDWIWATYFSLSNMVADFETVTLHEFGHAHGLGHPFNDCAAGDGCPMTPGESASVMNPNYSIKRSLTSDDRAGLAVIY